MNKKIKIEIMVGIILITVLIFGGLRMFSSHKKSATSSDFDGTKEMTQNIQQIQKLDVPVDWKQYKNDVLGIEFYYPEKWGKPTTNPVQYITNLAHIVDRYGSDNSYHNNLSIDFPNSEISSPNIRVFNESFEVKPDVQAYHYYNHIAGNISDVKKSGNICDYTVNFIYLGDNQIQETASDCDNGVKEILTQDREVFNFNDFRTLYSYDLMQFAYKKLQNGYFDNVFVKYRIADSGQVKESSLTKDAVLGLEKLTPDDYWQMKNDFAIFSNSIQSYTPAVPEREVFQDISGEDPNLTTIRKYYFALSNGDLETAYALYKEKNVSFDEFKEWYRNTYFAHPTQFEKIGENQYRFLVDFQDNNTAPQRYRVSVEVSTGKIKTLSSGELIGQKAIFKNKSVFVEQVKGKNYVILSENDQEQAIDESDVPSERNFRGFVFSNPEFSPNGNFIRYGVTGWEWYETRIYDIQKKKITLELSNDSGSGFTPDETYFYACSTGKVYSLPDFKVQYDLFYSINENFIGVECNYDNVTKVVRFTLPDYHGNGRDTSDQKRVIEYSLAERKEHVVE